ncbi:MAG: asparagine synthase (glutamine-hydrolyzing) [Gemmatimonadota bacterium]
MCGIVGILNRNGQPVDSPLLAYMASALDHRGPDDEGQYIDGALGFHHKRLAIIDLTSGHQPMTSGRFTIAYNGEIYNYLELRDELIARGHEFHTTSDTEVILAMYEAFGPACVERMNGMFAFLLHDRVRGQLFAARDRFGIKPLYLYENRDVVLFASEIKALLRHPAVPAESDPEALRDYLTFQYVLGAGTMFRDIRKVLPGHYLLVDLGTGRLRSRQYWEPNFTIDPYHTEEYFVEQLRALLEDAVRLQLRSDVPVGTYLSGGLDSSIVTMLAARISGVGHDAFTGSFREGPEFDESDYARDIAAACGATMHEIIPTQQEFVALLPRLIYHMDEPVAGPGLFPQYIVSRYAARHVKVVLGGQGGDEVFGGYTRYLVAYFEQALKGAISENNEEAEHIVSLQSIVPNLPALREYVPMLRQFWRQGVFEPMDQRYFRLVDRSGGALSLYTPAYRDSYKVEAIFERFSAVFNHPETKSYFNKMTHYDLVTGLPALLQVEDRVTMAVSLESRVPLLDHRLCDLLTSMPPRLKFQGGELKYALKRAVRPIVPPRIVDRRDKMGFPVPLHLWARGESRDFFGDLLLSRTCRERGIFEAAEIEKLMDYETAFSRRLWGLLNLELWHREFIDAPPAAAGPSQTTFGERAGGSRL